MILFYMSIYDVGFRKRLSGVLKVPAQREAPLRDPVPCGTVTTSCLQRESHHQWWSTAISFSLKRDHKSFPETH